MSRKRALIFTAMMALIITPTAFLSGSAGLYAQSAQAPVARKTLTPNEKRDLEILSEQIRANQRKSDANRASARQIASQIEDLRAQIINMTKSESVSEKRAAIYRARLETLNVLEADMTQKLGALRAKESRLLSALQIYSRNPPPAIFISTRRANDAVVAAILMKAITPALRERAATLSQQNKQLIRLRREAQLNAGALIISESEITDQRARIEDLIRQRNGLEDQLLSQADQLDAERQDLRLKAAKLSGDKGLMAILGLGGNQKAGLALKVPVIGKRIGNFQRSDTHEPFGKGVSFVTASGAAVVAPGDGEVEYAGMLGSYGQVVILRVSEEYRVVITGLGRVYVEPGASVAQGEPLGRMSTLTQDKPVLYMELRKGDEPVNPAQGFRFEG